MSMLGEILSTVFERRIRFGTPGIDDGRPIEDLTADLVSAAGEISGRAIGRRILDRYDTMTPDEKLGFFQHLTRAFNIDPDRVRQMLDAYEAAPNKANYRAFLAAVDPARQELIRRLNQVPGGTERLVRMRADLLALMPSDPDLAALDLDFRHLFASWFNRGFLVLRPISWESPAHVLEKIIAYEAVHAIGSWDDLRRRVEPEDRRCFAFFHPAMPDEPLIFVEVALTKGIPGSVQALLAEDRAPLATDIADTAVFYSISNCQAGLASISFGNSLIKQVAADLALELPGLSTFVTLSPIPGFAAWFDAQATGLAADDEAALRPFAAAYLVDTKRSDGLPLDPVARFHLGNGATIHKVHAGADLSAKGQSQSYGMMVNYLYDLDRVAENHEGYAASHSVAHSSEIKTLAAQAQKTAAQKGAA